MLSILLLYACVHACVWDTCELEARMGWEVRKPATGEVIGLGTRYWECRGLGAGCWRDHRPRFVSVGVWVWDLLANFEPNYLARIRSFVLLMWMWKLFVVSPVCVYVCIVGTLLSLAAGWPSGRAEAVWGPPDTASIHWPQPWCLQVGNPQKWTHTVHEVW